MSEEKQNTPTDEQKKAINKALDDTHNTAKGFIRNRNETRSPVPTKEELQEDAERAKEIVDNLHNTIKENTPDGSVKEAMSTDRENADKAQNDIKNGKDPLAAYAGYSAYAVPQGSANDPDRNYYENPLTYDEYAVTEDKNKKNININLTELTPGGKAHATNNENGVIGSSVSEESYSYNEKKSGGKTIITTKQTQTGTHTPSSFHITAGEDNTSAFTYTKENEYIYDKQDRLTEQTSRSTSENVIADSKTVSHKGQDMSQGPDKGYFRTSTEISSLRGDGSRFAHVEYNKNREKTAETTGYLSRNTESYIRNDKKNMVEVQYHQNDKGEWVYEGSKSKIDNEKTTDTQTLTSKQAQKEFHKIKKDVNKEINKLTGANDLSGYAERLGTQKPKLSASPLFNAVATEESKEKADEANKEIEQKYADTPAAIVAIKLRQQKGR